MKTRNGTNRNGTNRRYFGIAAARDVAGHAAGGRVTAVQMMEPLEPRVLMSCAPAVDFIGPQLPGPAAVASVAGPVATAIPANDNFANATVLAGTSITATGTNVNATVQLGEPLIIAGSLGIHSVWWSWTAGTSGVVALNTHGSSFDTTLGVFTGNAVSSLTLVASNDDTSSSDLTSALTFNAVAGTTYHIDVNGYLVAEGSIAMHLNEALPVVRPANDNFANRTAISGTSITVAGTNVNATRESGEPSINSNSGGTSVWYTWTAGASGVVSLDTHGSNFDTMLGVYTGSVVSSLTVVASNDDTSSSDLTSALTFNAAAGTTYQIMVTGWGGASGSIAMHLNEALPVVRPANDNFANRTAISGTSITVAGTNVNATRESGEPSINSNSGGTSVWYTWTAGASGVVSLDTHGSNFDTMLGVYTGSVVSSLTVVASNDDTSSSDLTSELTFNAAAGTTYQIMVTGWGGASGSIAMHLNEAQPPQPPPTPTHLPTITTRYNGSELVIAGTGGNDTITVGESGNTLTITADGTVYTRSLPSAGLFIYSDGGADTITINSGVTLCTTIETIQGDAANTITSHGTDVGVWMDGLGSFTGTGTVHRVSSFYGNVSLAAGAHLADPRDIGAPVYYTASLWGTGPVEGDVNQRQIGDCWYVSTLASLAHSNPAQLSQMAVDMGDGTYAVAFDVGGVTTYVRVDNAFAGYQCVPGASGDVWALVMEKAYAAVRTGANTFASLNSGSNSEAMNSLGLPNQNYTVNSRTSQTSFYDAISQALANHEPVEIDTLNSPANVVGDHSYSLVGVSTNSAGQTFYTVRNPWGMSGDALENSGGYATLTFAEVLSNFDNCNYGT